MLHIWVLISHQYFSKQACLAISYVYGINGENVHYALGTDTDVPSTLLRVKFNYMFNDNLGAALGYTNWFMMNSI